MTDTERQVATMLRDSMQRMQDNSDKTGGSISDTRKAEIDRLSRMIEPPAVTKFNQDLRELHWAIEALPHPCTAKSIEPCAHCGSRATYENVNEAPRGGHQLSICCQSCSAAGPAVPCDYRPPLHERRVWRAAIVCWNKRAKS